ncbi:MAG: hypothetical protein R3E97_17225 [Candidatus Eisenbacteria bacterium]
MREHNSPVRPAQQPTYPLRMLSCLVLSAAFLLSGPFSGRAHASPADASSTTASLAGTLPGHASPATAFPGDASPADASPAEARDFDGSGILGVNQLQCYVSNFGLLARDPDGESAGLYYPTGTKNTVMRGLGLWIGGKVDGEVRVAVAEESSEFIPGRLLSDGSFENPEDPRFRVYRLVQPPGEDDSDVWPVDDGAPVGSDGEPRRDGDQSVWTVFHDGDPARHTASAGGTAPLGIEVRLTGYEFDRSGGLGSTIFLFYDLIHRGTAPVDSMYVGFWCDPDVGGPDDDLVGFDAARNLAFAYNSTNNDVLYANRPPAVGLLLERVSASPSSQATAFRRFVPGASPTSAIESYRALQGLDLDGSALVDPIAGGETTFEVGGDPNSGSGWLDTEPADRRMLVSSGPFTMAPADTESVVLAIVVARGFDRLASIGLLRVYALDIPGSFDYGACCRIDGTCTVKLERDCNGLDFFLGEDCDPSPCPLGACCESDGSCRVTAGSECTGIFEYGGTCDPTPCGVCCYPNGSCFWLSESQCLGGEFLFGETCDPNPCAVTEGACCDDDGTCRLLTESACAGSFLGIGVDCSPNPCKGACCHGVECSLVTETYCVTELEGTFHGNGTTCGVAGCTNLLWDWEGGTRWLTWVDAGFSTFNGGVGAGWEFFGSELTVEDLVPVEIRFTDEESEWSDCQTYRRDLGYAAAGIGRFPGSAWDISDPAQPRRLNINFVETMDLSYPEGIVPDHFWSPASSSLGIVGAREYLFIMASDYSGGVDYGDGDDLPIGFESDVLYGAWLQLRGDRPLLETVPSAFRFLVSPIGDPVGACCMNDGTCRITTADDCAGVLWDWDTACEPAECPSSPPEIGSLPEPTGIAGEPLTVEVTVTDDTAVSSVSCSFGPPGGLVRIVPMNALGSDAYSVTIPGSAVTPAGLVYRIQAFDDTSLNTDSPDVHVQVQFASVVNGSPQPAGTAASAYRIVSFPGELTEDHAFEVLADELGAYDPTIWRAFLFTEAQNYEEFSSSTRLEPGVGYFLIVRESGRVLGVGSGTSIDTAAPFEQTVHAGWNLVGNPYATPISGLAVTLASGAPIDLRAYAGSWSASVDSLHPFEGYALYSETADVMRWDPATAGEGVVVGGAEVGAVAHASAGAVTRSQLFSDRTGAVDWSVRVIASRGESRDDDNFAVVGANARATWDALDRPEPPTIGEWVQVTFPHPEWKRAATDFSTDARSPNRDGHTWPLSVRSWAPGTVDLTCEVEGDLPEDFGIWLLDTLTGEIVDLSGVGASDRSAPHRIASHRMPSDRVVSHRVASPGPSGRAFQLLVGTENLLAEGSQDIDDTLLGSRSAISLPNPFQRVTTIAYRMTEPGPVRIRVYAADGRSIRDLSLHEAVPPGIHTMLWDGRDGSGARVPSGVYFARVEVPGRMESVRLNLVR